MNLFRTVKQYPSQLFLIGISFAFFLLRLPSLVEPYWYGDEGVYEVIGSALAHGRVLYTGIWDNKPPLLYYIYSLFAGDQGSVRFVSLIVGLISVLFFFVLSKKLFSSIRATYIATAIFAILFATPFLEGNIANAENFMLLPGIVAGLLVWKAIQERHTIPAWKYLFLAGFLLGISFLIKIVAVFDFAAFVCFFFIASYASFSLIKKQIAPVAAMIGGFLIPIIFVFAISAVFHNSATFIRSAFTSNVGYVGYGNYFLFPQGLLVTKLILLALGVLVLFLKREKTTHANLFILLWLSFSLFSALFSQRPYTHYLLVLLPSFSLYLGLFVQLPKAKLPLGVGTAALFIVLFIFAAFRPQLIKSVNYYGNYAAFTYGNKSVDNYLAFFDRSAVRDYKLAEFINSHKNSGDSLFVWGNDGQLYKLTDMLPAGRYIVAYHILATQQTWTETAEALAKQQPTFVVVTMHQQPIPYSLRGYKIRLVVDGSYLYEKVF